MDSPQTDVSFEDTPTHIAAQKATTTPPAGSLNSESNRPTVAEFAPLAVPASVQSQVTPTQRIGVAARETGVIVGSTLEEQYRLARYYAASNLMPATLNTPERVLVALQLCHELGLPPMSSIGKICVVNGTPSLFGDLPLSLVRRSGLLDGFDEYFLDKDGTRISLENKNLKADFDTAVCQAKRKGGEHITRTFSIEDAETAGLWGKKSASGKPTPWVLYPKRMMQFRARSQTLKDLFPDVLSGAGILEYDHNTVTDEEGRPVDIPVNSAAKELNETYLPKETAQ